MNGTSSTPRGFTRRPFSKTEDRALTFTEQISEARQSAAEGVELSCDALAAVEIVAGLYSRAFSQAKIKGVAVDFPADALALVGRSLAVKGQCVLYVEDGEPMPASTWDISGGKCDPVSWRYKLTIPVPNGTKQRTLSAKDILHFRINAAPERPWEGRSPFAIASDTATLAAAVERALRHEMRVPVGGVIPIPNGSSADSLKTLKRELRTLKGDFIPLESMSAGWGDGPSSQVSRDWGAVRYRPEPDSGVVKLHDETTQSLLAAAGVPVELATAAEGSATREAWRRFLHATMQPLGNFVVAELRRKLSGTPSIDFDALMASDLSGRARAFQSMVGGGMSVERAATLAGLLADD